MQIANDISSRDIQFSPQSGGQWVLGKSFDTFCPLGPYMVTPDAVGRHVAEARGVAPLARAWRNWSVADRCQRSKTPGCGAR
eukprot:scaffold8106_cov403-Prasinococcus_capsulatus_cf.AAC.3